MKGHVNWLWQYARPAGWRIFAVALLFVSMDLTYLGVAWVQQWLIDDVFLADRFDRLWVVMTCFAIVCIFHIGCHSIGAYLYVKPVSRICRRLIDDVMRSIYQMPVPVFQKERTAKFVHHLSDDAPRIGEFIGIAVPRLFATLGIFLFLSIFISVASPILFGIIALVSAVYILFIHYFQPRIQRMSKEVQDQKTKLLVTVEEGLSATREVIAFHRLKWEANQYQLSFNQYFTQVMKQGKLVNLQLFMVEPLKWGAVLIVLGYGGYLVMQNQLSLGMFVVMYTFANHFMEKAHSLFEQMMEIFNHLGYVERVRELQRTDQVKEGGYLLEKSVENIRFERVQFSYHKDQSFVLRDLSIDLPVGSKIAFVGLSGGGKTTIAQLLIRFFEPVDGTILVNGIPLSEIKDWNKRVDIAFQEPYLFSDTIRTNLLMGTDHIPEGKMIEVCKQMLIHDVIRLLPRGYDTEIGERGIVLSGGQRQRLALARAMIGNPEILILDEATSSLDLETERQVQKNLDEMRKGKTTIIIAHRLSTVQNADVIYVMDQGRVVEQGVHEQLLVKGPVYRKLVFSQVESGHMISIDS